MYLFREEAWGGGAPSVERHFMHICMIPDLDKQVDPQDSPRPQHARMPVLAHKRRSNTWTEGFSCFTRFKSCMHCRILILIGQRVGIFPRSPTTDFDAFVTAAVIFCFFIFFLSLLETTAAGAFCGSAAAARATGHSLMTRSSGGWGRWRWAQH